MTRAALIVEITRAEMAPGHSVTNLLLTLKGDIVLRAQVAGTVICTYPTCIHTSQHVSCCT